MEFFGLIDFDLSLIDFGVEKLASKKNKTDDLSPPDGRQCPTPFRVVLLALPTFLNFATSLFSLLWYNQSN